MLRDALLRICSVHRRWLRSLDRGAAELNIVLAVFAIGLATLDLTFMVTQRMVDRLPPLTHVVSDNERAAAQSPAAVHPDGR
jgi:hypothetical protein